MSVPLQAVSKTSQATESSKHLVQFYDVEPGVWAKSVGRFLADGVASGEAAIVIATPEHQEAIARQLSNLGYDFNGLGAGHLRFLDAAETLAKFMAGLEPEWDRFQQIISAEIRGLRAASVVGRFRAYGEMVGLLWSAGNHSAAIALEEFWNRLLESETFQLFCGYPINIFGDDEHPAQVDAIVRAHTHVVATTADGPLVDPVRQAIYEVKNPGSGLEILDAARRKYRTERRFRALIENSSDVISLLDAGANITYSSASTGRVLGFQPQELIGRNVLGLVHPEDLAAAQKMLEEVRTQPRIPVPAQARVSAKDGQWLWVEGTFTNLIDDPDVAAIVANYRDITDRKDAEARQRRDAEELARYNTELESFAYAATHDLREPLRTVAAFTQLLVDRSGSDEECEKYSKFILDSVAHMSSMLDDLLALTSLSSQDARHRVDLRSAVDQAISFLEQTIQESGATITVGPLPCVLGNESQLTGLMQNLLANAMKYRSQQPVEIEVSAQRVGSGWLVKVKHNGIGIAPAYQEQIFGLFKRLQKSVPGTGIGLAICKKIVDGMGGRIWVESEPGQGSTFCFTAQAA